MRNHITCLFMLLALCQLKAQQTKLPSERIFIYPEQSSYDPGDTVRVHGQLFASSRQQPFYSQYVYVELFNLKDSVLIRKKTRCDNDGSFSLPVITDFDWPKDIYYLRAYTRLMQNFHPESYPVTELPLGLKPFISEENVPGVKCFFYPEGGQLVDDGGAQNMTVYFTDGNGMPLQIPFILLSKTDTLFRAASSLSGLQTIRFYPSKDKEYSLSVNYKGEDFSFSIPDRTENHTLQAILSREEIRYKILPENKRINKERLFIFHPATGLEEMVLTEKQRAGILNIPQKESGLYILFLTDENANPIAQCALWKKRDIPDIALAQNEYLPGERILLKTDYPAAKVHYRVLKKGQMMAPGGMQSEFDCELLSPVPFPKSCFTYNKGETEQDLEAWLRTARFIRFDLPKVLNKDFQYKYQPEIQTVFRGLVTRKSSKPLRNGTIVAYNTMTNLVNEGIIDNNGRYTLTVDDFEEGDRFFLQAHPPKGTADFYDYTPDNDTFPPVINRLQTNLFNRKYAETNVSYQDSSGFFYKVDNLGNRDYLIPEITVKARTKRDKYISTEKFYKTNYIDEEDMEKHNYTKLEDIIADMPYIHIAWNDDSNPPEPILVSTRGISTLKGGAIVILVDGKRMTLEEALNIVSPQQIATVELLRPWQTNAMTFGAIGGAFSITTKRNRGAENVISKGFYYYPIGLTQGNRKQKDNIIAPSSPGSYELLVDMVTERNETFSYKLPFTVR